MIDIIERAGARLDAVVLPKVTGPGPVIWLDLLLSQVELPAALPPGRIRIEAQIEDAAGLAAADEIAGSSPRLAALDRAERILEAYEHATSVRRRGAVMHDGEMIDEAWRAIVR